MVIPPPSAYATTLSLMLVPLAIWSTIASIELIAVRRAFRTGEPLGLDLAVLTRARMLPVLLAPALSMPWVLPVAAALRLAAGLALPVAAATGAAWAVAGLASAVAGCTVWLAIATGGGDGADKMALVACVAAALIAAGIATDDRLLCLAGLAWSAGQATIAYATSGGAKLARRFWRDGTALTAAMTSHRSGHAFAAAAVRRRPAAVAIAWAIMLVEALAPLMLVAPPPVCLAVLAVLALFHLATAFVMGLNTYPWAFAASYPCVVLANAILTGALR